MKKTKLYLIISLLIAVLFFIIAALCNQNEVTSVTEAAAVETAEDDEAGEIKEGIANGDGLKEDSEESGKSETTESSEETSGKFDKNLVGTWVSDCLVPDPDSPWSEKHQFIIGSDGSAIHIRWSSSGQECVADETVTNNYRLTIPSSGQIDIKDNDLNQTIYDIYKISGNTLLFGHGFRGDSAAMQVKDNNFGLNPETRHTTLNEFIVYKK